MRYQEFSNLSEPVPVLPKRRFNLSGGAAGTSWVDQLISDGAKVIVGYEHPHFGRFPSVVSSEHGQGRITTVGTLPNPVWPLILSGWRSRAQKETDGLPASVTVYSATNSAGERIHVVHNWSWAPVQLHFMR